MTRELDRLNELNFRELQSLLINQHEFTILQKAHSYYHNNIVDYDFTYTYVDDQNKLEKLKINFKDYNFQHLTGIGYYDLNEDGLPHAALSASTFYDTLLKSKFDILKAFKKTDGTTELKLNIITALPELFTEGVRVAGRGKYLSLEFDQAIRTNKQLMALTVLKKGAFSVPQSLINLKTTKGKTKSLNKAYEVVSLSKEKFRSKEEPIILFNNQESLSNDRNTKKLNTKLDTLLAERQHTDSKKKSREKPSRER